MLGEISTFTIHNELRRSILDLQKQLSESQREMSSGRVANLAAALGGGGVARDFSLGFRLNDLSAIAETNKLVSSRLEATQTSLNSLVQSATELRSSLLASKNVFNPTVLQSQAGGALSSFVSTLNTSDSGAFIFAGLHTDVAPIADYGSTPASLAKQAVDASFATAFGTTQSGPGVGSIGAAQMQSFLDGPFANLFSSANWAANWSSASNQPIQSRISLSQTSITSVTANDPAFQELAMAYVMVNDLGLSNLNNGAYQAVLETAASHIDHAIAALNGTRGNIGVVEKNVLDSNEVIASQTSLLQGYIGDLENVDPAATATKVNELMTQIETAYSLTAKIGNLSLVKFL